MPQIGYPYRHPGHAQGWLTTLFLAFEKRGQRLKHSWQNPQGSKAYCGRNVPVMGFAVAVLRSSQGACYNREAVRAVPPARAGKLGRIDRRLSTRGALNSSGKTQISYAYCQTQASIVLGPNTNRLHFAPACETSNTSCETFPDQVVCSFPLSRQKCWLETLYHMLLRAGYISLFS